MTSRLVVNNIDNDTGVTTIRLNPTYSSFELNSAERVRIKSDGKVGIGTDNPSSEVHLYGNAPVLTVTPTNWQSGLRLNVVGLGYHGSNNQLFRVQKDGTTKLQLNEDGDLVITGDDNAELKLQCGTSSGNNIIAFLNSSGTTKGNIFYDSDHNFMVFKTNGTASADERLRITSSGLVGINTATGGVSSNAILSINSPASSACRFNLMNTGSSSVESTQIWSQNNDLVFNTAGDERLRINSDGRALFDRGAPSSANKTIARFQCESSRRLDIVWHDSGSLMGFDTPSSHSYIFKIGGSEKVRIASGGGIELKTDGKGIEFPTPQTPTNSNPNRVGISSEMRYYETGTFTPGLSSTVLNSLQNEAFTNASYARRVGRYVRVGSLVHVTIEILMASSVTYNSGSTSTAPVCIVGATPFYYAYAQRYDVSGQPDYYPCSISYSSTNLTNDTLYATLRRDFAGEARIEITKPGTGGSRQYNSTNFGEVFPANAHINVSCTYCIDSSNADY